MSKTPEEIIEGAIKGVERDGWYQGSYYPEVDSRGVNNYEISCERAELASQAGPACAMGHLSRAAFGHAWEGFASVDVRHENREAYAEAHSLVKAAIGGGEIPYWNDDAARTKEDVILAFKKALNHEKAD